MIYAYQEDAQLVTRMEVRRGDNVASMRIGEMEIRSSSDGELTASLLEVVGVR